MDNAEGILHRVRSIEEARLPERVGIAESQVKDLRGDLHELKEEVRGLKRALWAAAVTFGAATVGLLVNVAQIIR